MANKTMGAWVVCPYYQGYGKKSLLCEWLVKGCGVSIRFPDEDAREHYQKQLCCSLEAYHRCPVARMMDKRYERQGRENGQGALPPAPCKG